MEKTYPVLEDGSILCVPTCPEWLYAFVISGITYRAPSLGLALRVHTAMGPTYKASE